ncbi:porin [Amaricoccus solimangrovi]|uniref:Porin n=1 Tax=Amaricoccus solimangrovi TaxID=2589815 RepID=A0A501WVB6_9RHOB|nr:porin [Amaricoccus solimangrovi]TPE52064.1 porin [Amaricoccus solimangrovi]
MKKVLFASSALAALAIGGAASAQGISLFGTARLGLGYGINNDGTVDRDADGSPTDDMHAVSRVRFGVNMTGETNSGITFGATIRADNAIGGNGGAENHIGQTAGEVFVSGSFGTLTYGDTNAADEQWVGDLIGDYSLTGLGDLDETVFLSNGGGFGNDNTNDFFSDPEARPTVRYDFEIAGFGLSLSANKDLNSYGVGGGYAGNFGGGTFNIGLGYYDYTEFDIISGTTIDTVPGGKQYSAVIGGTFGDYGANVIYDNADSDGADFSTLGIGLTAGFGDFDLGAWYRQVIDAGGALDGWDGADAYAFTGQYDLGGGATVNGGVEWTYDTDDIEGATVADFGISMAF